MLATCLASGDCFILGDHFFFKVGEHETFCWLVFFLLQRFVFFLFLLFPPCFFLVGGKILHHPNFETKINDFEVTNPLKSVRVVLGPKLSLGDEHMGVSKNRGGPPKS